MSVELAALLALAIARRAAGQPCNPHRDGRDDVDWLTEDEIQRAHCLTLRIAIAEKQAAALHTAEWAAVGVAA